VEPDALESRYWLTNQPDPYLVVCTVSVLEPLEPGIVEEDVTVAEHFDPVQCSLPMVTFSVGPPTPFSRVLTITDGVAPPVKSTAVWTTSKTSSLVMYGQMAISPRSFSEPTTFFMASCGVFAPVAGENR
jgi:hypothetical protein